MNTTENHTAAAPRQRPEPEPFTGPVDIIEDCHKQIRALARVMEFSLSEEGRTGDGPGAEAFGQCFNIMGVLCDRIQEAVAQLDAADLAKATRQ